MVAILRTSERKDFLRCPQRWWWAWREGLRAKGSAPDALWFGTGIHVALAEWYVGPGTRRGPHPAETWQAWAGDDLRDIKTVNELDEEQEVKYVDAIHLGTVMMEEYVKLYGRDEQKLIIKPEKTFRLPVPWPSDQQLYPDWEVPEGAAENARWLFDYCGTFDGVWRDADTGRVMLDEHKTAAQISTGHLSLDPQAGSYWAVASRVFRQEGLIGPKEVLWGIEYNFMRKALPDERPRDAEGFATNIPQKAHYIAAMSGLTLRAVPDTTERVTVTAPILGKMKLDALVRLANANDIVVVGDRSKVQPARNFERLKVHRTRPERYSQLVRLQHEGLHMVAVKDGILPILKNPDRTCNQGAFRCQFFEMCELHEAGGEDAIVDYKRSAYYIQDPYADHREK